MTSDHTRRMFADSVSANDNDSSVVNLIDELNRMAADRHAWLSRAAAQIERWKAEDAASGNPWGDDAA